MPVSGELPATTLVLATLQGIVAKNHAVKSAVASATTSRITIGFTASVAIGTTVAWFALG